MPENGSLVDQGQPFEDSKGQTWLVKITVFGIKRVKELLGINIFKLSENNFEGLIALLDDELTLVNVIYVLCEDQLTARKVSDRQFGESLDGEAFGRASEAFLAAYINFSPDPRIRAALRSLQQKALAAIGLMLTEAEKRIEEATPESMARQLSERFITSPASLDETRAPIASAPSSSCATDGAPTNGHGGRAGSASTSAPMG